MTSRPLTVYCSAVWLLTGASCGRVEHDTLAVERGVQPNSSCPGPQISFLTRVNRTTDALGVDESSIWLRRNLGRGATWEARFDKRTGVSLPLEETDSPAVTFVPSGRVREGSTEYALVDSREGVVIEQRSTSSGRSNVLVRLPESPRDDADGALLFYSPHLFVTGSSGRVFRVDSRSGELTLLAACEEYDDDDFRALFAADAEHLYFFSGPADASESSVALMRLITQTGAH